MFPVVYKPQSRTIFDTSDEVAPAVATEEPADNPAFVSSGLVAATVEPVGGPAFVLPAPAVATEELADDLAFALSVPVALAAVAIAAIAVARPSASPVLLGTTAASEQQRWRAISRTKERAAKGFRISLISCLSFLSCLCLFATTDDWRDHQLERGLSILKKAHEYQYKMAHISSLPIPRLAPA